MKLAPFPFQVTHWESVPRELHAGIRGTATWQILQMNDIRIRFVEYSPGYEADHWCSKGHIIFCISGAMETTLEDGRRFTLSAGMTYEVGDDCEAHRSASREGCRLFIVD